MILDPHSAMPSSAPIANPAPRSAFDGVLDALTVAAADSSGRGKRATLPSRDAVVAVVEGLRRAFFPRFFGEPDVHDDALRFHIGATLSEALHALEEQVRRAVAYAERHDGVSCGHCRAEASRVTASFLGRLPEVRRLLATDVDAAFAGDPALRIKEEAIFSYPGIFAITEQRIAHELYALGVPLIPRIISEHAHSQTGIDIHPGATIGEGFFVDHGTGVVIGETSRIGDRVRIYQGVTLGAKSFPLDEHGNPIKGIDRHPILEDDVVVYSGATILGRITVGRGSSIGGNVWLTHGVPPGSRVTQAEVREARFEQGGGI
jgi:serine O-acetyltransferase